MIKTIYIMKTKLLSLTFLACISLAGAGQDDWAPVEKVFGKKGAVQDGVFKITFPRTDLKVMVGTFTVDPGLVLTSWIGFLKSGGSSAVMNMGGQSMMMGDLVLLDREVAPAVTKIVSQGLKVTAIHNHLVGETPALKYLHFSGMGDAVKLAEAIKSVISVTGTPLVATPKVGQTTPPDWSNVESVLGKGKASGNLLQYGFPRIEKLTESQMEIPAYMGMATGVNFQMAGEKAAIAGDFVLLADEVNPVIKALTENGISVTAIHNHMLYDNPRLFMMHYWAVGDPGKLALGLKAALDKTNSKR